MKYLVMIHIDETLRAAMPEQEFDSLMRGCLQKADELKAEGSLISFAQLQAPETARTLRVREGQARIIDGPYAESKEFFAGYNLIEASSPEVAMTIAQQFPWARIGSVELRPLVDIDQVRRRVGSAEV